MTSGPTFSYDISRTSSSGNQGTRFSGTVTGLTDGVSGFSFYVSGTDNGSSQNNLYVSAVPEPSTTALLLSVGALGFALFRRRLESNRLGVLG